MRLRIEQPFKVGPEEAEVRVMRVAFVIGVSVVNPMRADPTDRSALQRQRAKQRDRVFDGLGEAQTAMRQETMKSKRYAEAARCVDEDEHNDHGRRFEEDRQKRQERSNVKRGQRRADSPVKSRGRFRGVVHTRQS